MVLAVALLQVLEVSVFREISWLWTGVVTVEEDVPVALHLA